MGKQEAMRSKSNLDRKSSKQSALTVDRILWEAGIRVRDQSTLLAAAALRGAYAGAFHEGQHVVAIIALPTPPLVE
jgi:hypothetical protein